MWTIVHPRRSARLGLRVLALGLGGLTACITPRPPVPSPEAHALAQRAEVVASTEPPEIAFAGFAHGKLEGGRIGASSWLGACVTEVLGGGHCEGAICGAALLAGLGFCMAGTVVAGAAGAVIAPSADQVRAAEAELRSALGRNPLQESLRAEVLAAGRESGVEWGHSTGDREAARLEVALTRVETEGSGIDPPLQLSMTARARLFRPEEGAPLFEAEFRHEGERRRLAEWSADDGAPLLRALEGSYRALGVQIFERLVLLYPFPDRATHWGSLRSDFGLAPLDLKARLHVPNARSRRPTLRWQSFPRPGDLAAAPGEMRRIENVRYDLRIARGGQVIYRRDALPEPKHTLEESLDAGSVYHWSVRARFDLDGRPRVTEWSGMGPVGGAEPEPWWFRFETP